MIKLEISDKLKSAVYAGSDKKVKAFPVRVVEMKCKDIEDIDAIKKQAEEINASSHFKVNSYYLGAIINDFPKKKVVVFCTILEQDITITEILEALRKLNVEKIELVDGSYTVHYILPDRILKSFEEEKKLK